MTVLVPDHARGLNLSRDFHWCASSRVSLSTMAATAASTLPAAWLVEPLELVPCSFCSSAPVLAFAVVGTFVTVVTLAEVVAETVALVPTSASIVALLGLAAMAVVMAAARLDFVTEVSEDMALALWASVDWTV